MADLAAGWGRTMELLARAVGPRRAVHAQNDKATIGDFMVQSWPKLLEFKKADAS